METILLTGGAGFIGSHTAKALIEKGYSVICIDEFNNYYNPIIKEKNVQGILNFCKGKNCQNFELIRGDIRDAKLLEKVFEAQRIDKVIHIAARAGVRPSITEPKLYFDVNVNGTLNLLEQARKHKVKNFVFASSSSVYGRNNKIPFAEEDVTDYQVSPYAASKKSGELLCRTYSYLYDLNISCLRFFTVYGPSGRPDMAPYKFTDSIYNGKPIEMYGDGSSKRDYTYITDIVFGVVSAMEHINKFEIFNLGNSNPIELKKMISIIEGCTKKKAKIIQKEMPKEDVPMTYADISKAKKMLGYSPKINFKEGMKKFTEWYLKNIDDTRL